MVTTTTVYLPRLYERDIDVLLQEELLFNERVRELFSVAIGAEASISVHECRLSVVDATGETDLTARYRVGDLHGTLLIENKIDAAFQPRQPERYRERALTFARDGDQVFCILISPERYARAVSDAAKAFHAVISYEDLALAIGDLGTPRAQHRASLLLRAVQQSRKSTLVVPAPQVTNLWQRVFNIADTEFASLQMTQPKDKGSESWWLIFKANLPKYVTIDWKVKNGVVDLSYWRGAHTQPTESSPMPVGAEFLVTGTTAVFRMKVSKPHEDWSTVSDEQIREALSVAANMLDFHNLHQSQFSEGHS